jgi:hypothetical protein
MRRCAANAGVASRSRHAASVTAPPTPSAAEVGCGGSGAAEGGKWTVTLSSLQATSAQFIVTWSGEQVLCRNYTLDGPATGTAC